MKIFTILLLLLLSGCAMIAGNIPSLQYCDEVKYERRGNQIELQARCAAPIGGGL